MDQTPEHRAQETQTRRMQFAASRSIAPFPATNGPKLSRASSLAIARVRRTRHRPYTFGLAGCECSTTASASNAGDVGWIDMRPRHDAAHERRVNRSGFQGLNRTLRQYAPHPSA